MQTGHTQQLHQSPLEVVKNLWQEEVEKGPELSQVVLQRRSGQEELVVSRKRLQLSHQPTIQVFDPVTFIHDEILPLKALKDKPEAAILTRESKRREASQKNLKCSISSRLFFCCFKLKVNLCTLYTQAV